MLNLIGSTCEVMSVAYLVYFTSCLGMTFVNEQIAMKMSKFIQSGLVIYFGTATISLLFIIKSL